MRGDLILRPTPFARELARGIVGLQAVTKRIVFWKVFLESYMRLGMAFMNKVCLKVAEPSLGASLRRWVFMNRNPAYGKT